MWRPKEWQRLPAATAEALKPPPLFGIPTQPELLTTLTCFKGRTLRHCQVEKNQPDAISILPENIERFNSINGREHLKAE